jgi:hypothetical protein
VDHRRIDSGEIARFFEHDAFRTAAFDNRQDFDWNGIRGRLLSSSYAPLPGSPKYPEMMEQLEAIFTKHQQEGRVAVLYETKLYAGKLD